ncbi:MAG: sulfatase-like hydrolase/transferase, partial [Pseudomonadota bacterium]
YWDMYDPADVTLPASFAKSDLPPVRAMRDALANGSDPRDNQSPFAVTEDEARAIIALTYGMITMIDDAVGRVFARLEALDLAEDTVVIFTSDHGDYMGDHGLMLKLLLHYQSIIRVPFIWRDPGQAAAGVAEPSLASSIDIASTILARAGVQGFNGMQGRDLFADPPPEAIIVEEDSQRSMIGFERPQRVRTIVTARHRMSLREGEDWSELYDLAADPHEMRNLYDDPAAADMRRDVTEAMLRRMIQLQDRAPLPAYRA